MNISNNTHLGTNEPNALVQFGSHSDLSPIKEYIYVCGQVSYEFTAPGLRHEFERCLNTQNGDNPALLIPLSQTSQSSPNNADESESEKLHKLLIQPQFRYLAQGICWNLMDSYKNTSYRLSPTTSTHLQSLITSLKPKKNGAIRNVMVVGTCSDVINTIPNLSINHLFSISPLSLIKKIASKDSGMNQQSLKNIVGEMLSLVENTGDTNKDRAINHLLFHNPEVYSGSYSIINGHNSVGSNSTPLAKLNSIQVLSQSSGERQLERIIFEYQKLQGGGNEYWFSAVDVTDKYPFVVEPFKRYLPRY